MIYNKVTFIENFNIKKCDLWSQNLVD